MSICIGNEISKYLETQQSIKIPSILYIEASRSGKIANTSSLAVIKL